MTTTLFYSGNGGLSRTILVTPTLTVAATYASGDFVGTSATALIFTNAARFAGGAGTIIGATLIDYALQSVAAELWLFSAIVTPPNDSAAWTITDAHSKLCIGVIPFSTYYATAANSISTGTIPNGNIGFILPPGATSLYGALVTRGAPSYADGDLTIRLLITEI
jgi:hypothetical protein